MTEAEALLEVASAIRDLAKAVSITGSTIGTVLWLMLLFKNMGTRVTVNHDD